MIAAASSRPPYQSTHFAAASIIGGLKKEEEGLKLTDAPSVISDAVLRTSRISPQVDVKVPPSAPVGRYSDVAMLL